MTACEQYLITLLRAFLERKTAPPPPDDLDYERLSLLAKNGAVAGIVGYMLLPYMDQIPTEWSTYWQRAFYTTAANFENKSELCVALTKELDAHGIPYAILKGMAIKGLYPVPQLRTFGDVDVFVPPAFRERLIAYIKDNGDTVSWEDDTQVCIQRQSLFVEFHFDLHHDAPRGLPLLGAYIAQAEQHMQEWSAADMKTVSPTFHFIYMLSHQMRHFETDSAGLRSFLDIAVWIQSGQIPERDILKPLLEQYGLLPFAQRVMQLITFWFGISSPLGGEAVPAADADFLLSYILDAGQFAKKQNPRAAQVQSKGSRLKALCSSLFPPAAEMRESGVYGDYAARWLPLAYAYRLYRGIRFGKHTADSVKNITTAANDAHLRARAAEILKCTD